MARVSRLKLGGVRSFGPDVIQEIAFQSPVTLILGENGCGKTTIIEALKFACTGATPGGTTAKANFVFNPQLSSASRTKAVVKIKFVNSRGEQICINRGMRVEQIALKKQTYVATDASLSIIDADGTEHTISTRCTDITKMVCERLGVSESIMNSVIFCHQENSLWPLDEGKKVKEMFDEIFDSYKYNKCVDMTNSKIKKFKEELKFLTEQLTARQSKKELVERKRAQLLKTEKDLEGVEAEIAKKEDEVVPIQAKLNDICKKEDNFTALKQELTSKETEKRNLQQNQRELRKKLQEEFRGTDEELELEIEVFGEKLKNLPTINQLNNNIEQQNTLIRKSQAKIGQLNAEKEQFNDMILDRNTNINNLSRELSLDINITGSSNLSIHETIDTLRTSLSKSKNTVEELQNKFTNDENLLQKDIDKSREDVAKINQKISSNNAQVKQIKQKLRDVTLQLNRLGSSGEELKQLNNKIEKIDNDLKKLSASFNTTATEELIKVDKQEIHKLEDELISLEKDYKVLQNNFELENNIETRSKDIRDKENKIYELKTSHYDEFKILFEEIPESNVKLEVEDLLRTNKKIVSDLQKKLENKNAEVTKLETNVKFKKEELSSLEDELETSSSKIKSVTKGQSYADFVKQVEKELEFYHNTKGQLEAGKIMYERFLQTFKSSKPCCPVCETNFRDDKTAVQTIINKIQTRINDIPSKLLEAEEKLNTTQQVFNHLHQTKPVYERIETLTNNLIPNVNNKLSNLNQECTTSKLERDVLTNDLEKPHHIVEISTKIMSNAALIDKYQTEIITYKKEVDELQEQMTTIESEKSREEVEAEIKVCKLNITQKRQMCESNQRKLLEFRDQCQDLKEKRNKFFDKRLQLEKSMHGKPQLLDQEMELKGDEVVLLDDIKTLENELQPIKNKLNDLIHDLQRKKGNNRAEISKRHDAYSKLSTTFHKITLTQGKVEQFERKNIDREVNEQVSKQEQYKNDLDSLATQKDMVNSSNIKQRELQDNLDIRFKQKKIESLSQAIATLETQIKDYNHGNLLKEKHVVQAKYTSIVKETCTLTGKKEQLEVTIETEKKELDRREYKEAYIMYRNKYFELKIKERVLRELQIYSRVLEKAIINFHKEKMMNINNLIRDYWRSIYRGNDIDYIQIKTEQPPQTKLSVTSVRRTYNYKVVQVKNDTEIDMRGCCSAGQKVLACLIIRMALSTVFSHNCGILALDEPTTNLDRENIFSLSETLAKMIQDRRVEKNFQLLVITHDEDFVRALSQTGSIETCLKVTRDQRGMSVVKTETIT